MCTSSVIPVTCNHLSQTIVQLPQPRGFTTLVKPASAQSEMFISWGSRNKFLQLPALAKALEGRTIATPILQEGLCIPFKGATVLALNRSQNPESNK